MVECECICSFSCVNFVACVLLDTWWNVNLTSTGYVRRDFRVLIDTWWNVNVGDITGLTVFEGVLIDTWWNVNQQG